MVIYIRYGLRRGGGGFAGEHVCREIPSSSFNTAEIQHASMSCVYCPIVARQLLCSVQLQLLPYLTLPIVNLFWLAGVFLVEVRWTWTLLSGIKVGGNARERRSQARHFCNLAFRGLKQRFSRGNARSQAGKIVLWECNFSSELINLNLVKISAWLEIQGPATKLNGAHIFFFYKGPVIFIVPTILKLHLTPAVSLLYSEKLENIVHKLRSGSFEKITARPNKSVMNMWKLVNWKKNGSPWRMGQI